MCVRVTFGSVILQLASGGEGYFSSSFVTLSASKQGVGELGKYFEQALQGILFKSNTKKSFTHEAYVILSATKTATLKGVNLLFSKSGTSDKPNFPDTAKTLKNTSFTDVGTVSLAQSSSTKIGTGSFSFSINDSKAEVIDEATMQTLLDLDPNNKFCQDSL